MRVLTKLEMNEFNKTFDFIDGYIGTASRLGANNIHQIRFDGNVVPVELMKFANNFKNLKEISNLFNNSTSKLRQSTMQRLIKYCFANRVQPYKLRVIFKEYLILDEPKPIIYEFQGDVA